MATQKLAVDPEVVLESSTAGRSRVEEQPLAMNEKKEDEERRQRSNSGGLKITSRPSSSPEIVQRTNVERECDEKSTNNTDLEEPDPSDIPQPTSDSASLTPDDHIYPEGGLKAWLVVFGSWCGMFASLGIANSLASFQAYISDNQLSSYSPGAIGWIFSIYTFLSFACGIYIGPLFDVYGPRWLILPGSAILLLAFFLIGICHGNIFLLPPKLARFRAS